MMQPWQIWGLIGWLLISTAARAAEPTTAPAAYDSASAVVRIPSLHGPRAAEQYGGDAGCGPGHQRARARLGTVL